MFPRNRVAKYSDVIYTSPADTAQDFARERMERALYAGTCLTICEAGPSERPESEFRQRESRRDTWHNQSPALDSKTQVRLQALQILANRS